jgi:chromosome segregation protein
MYLEKLEILGFKSFANKNKLEFSGFKKNGKRGITAIVGPNGSGKSNIADAVRWVLGEQSVKTLRGKKGEDIIFSGSDQKSRLGMAEVSLFLRKEDKDKKNPNDHENGEVSPFDYDQLIITRRITRSGESEYLINNNRVRLLDIQILLAKANIGQKTYSVIGQGLVENFLNTNAAEKKEFFDEATGVKSYQIKRDGALNKLEKSYDNLNQVDMLLSEIEPRLKTLTRQVEKLKKRDSLEYELKDKQSIYYKHFYQSINEKLKNINQEILKLEEKKNGKELDLNKLLKENEKFSSTSDNNEEEEIKERLQVKLEEKNKLIKELAKLQAEISLNLENQGNYDLSWLNQKKDELINKKEIIKNQIKQTESHVLIEDENNLKKEWQEIQIRSSKIEKDKEKKEINQKELNQLQEKLIRIEAIIETKQEKINNFDHNLYKKQEKELKEKINTYKEKLDKYDLENQEILINKKEENLTILINEIKEKQEKLRNLNYEIEEKSQQGIGKRTINEEIGKFLNYLEEIEKEDNLEKLKNLVSQARKSFKEKIQTLVGFDEEKLLEKVKNLQEDIIILSEKRQEKINNLNQLKNQLLKDKNDKNHESFALEKLENELNDLKNKINYLTKDDNLDQLYQEKNELNYNISEKKEILSKLSNLDLIKEIQEKKDLLIEKLNTCRLEISSRNEKIKILKQNHHQIEDEISDIKNKIYRHENILSTEELFQEKNKINEKISILEKTIEELKIKLKEFDDKRYLEKKQLIFNQNKADSLRNDLNYINKSLHEFEIEATRQETKLEDLEENIKNENLNLIEIKKYNIEEFVNNLDYNELLDKINQIKKQLDQIGSLDPETENEYHETKKRYDFLSQQTNDLKETINSLEKIISQLDEKIKSRFEKEFKIIAEKFNQYFNLLFNGGQAKIIKITEDKGEEEIKIWRKKSALGLSGIDILAIPPGKKIQSIAMLSGGERALTAIALICAIINVNPSPFVVLDEVDAALDEANSEKLANILEELSKKTQFIVITHNRATMRKSELLYGITMQKDGISRLLSIKLEDAMRIEEKEIKNNLP